jgi:hypothetical protein
LASRTQIDRAALAPAIEPLRHLFATASAENVRLKSELLGAMADIGSEAFKPEFLANLNSELDLLLPAIRGVEAVGAVDALDRVSVHLSHSEARVRQRAVEAIGSLSTQESHLNELRTRLDPKIETNEGVRSAAWNGFRKILSRLPAPNRLSWVERLGDLPDLQRQYLTALIEEWSTNTNPTNLENALTTMVALQQESGRPDDLIKYLQQLRRLRLANNDSAAHRTTLELLDVYLEASRNRPLVELIQEAAPGWENSARESIVDRIRDRLSAMIASDDSESARTLLDDLKSLDANSLGEGWLDALEAAVPSTDDSDPPPPDPDPNP